MDGRRPRCQTKAFSGLRGDSARDRRGPDRVGGDRGGLHQDPATHQLERTTRRNALAAGVGLTMNSFPQDFRAQVIGASGAIGAAFGRVLSANARCARVDARHRHSQPSIDFAHEGSIADAAAALAGRAPFHLIINAVGVLHSPHFMPEKKLGDLHYAQITVRSCRGNPQSGRGYRPHKWRR